MVRIASITDSITAALIPRSKALKPIADIKWGVWVADDSLGDGRRAVNAPNTDQNSDALAAPNAIRWMSDASGIIFEVMATTITALTVNAAMQRAALTVRRRVTEFGSLAGAIQDQPISFIIRNHRRIRAESEKTVIGRCGI